MPEHDGVLHYGMTQSQYEKFMERVAADPRPCRYGHMLCSDRHGGPCSDEESQNHYTDQEGEQ
jgi:hypothetical protein